MTFNDRLYASNSQGVYEDAQDCANQNGAPVLILERDGWLAICEEPTDMMEPDPIADGWTEVALIEPR